MMPSQQDAQKTTSAPFWVAVLAIWLVLFSVAAVLAITLAIWKLIEAF